MKDWSITLSTARFPRPTWIPLFFALGVAVWGCGSTGGGDSPGSGSDDAGLDATSQQDGQEPGQDASQDPVAEPMDLPDGTPTRQACTDTFGHGLTVTYGRLDGYLVSIVPPSSKHSCNADSDHLHLQILMKGAVYDISVNVADAASATTPVKFAEADAPELNGQWEEGWHATNVRFDYVSDLHLHSPNFGSVPTAQLAQKLEDDLAQVNHISVYSTAYGSDGGHLVHRTHGDTDGAIVIRPLSAVPHALAFCFADQGF